MTGKRRIKPIKLFDFANYTLLSVFAFITLYPFYYVIIYSISDPSEASKGLLFLPRGITASNYIQIMNLDGIFSAFFVSVARTVLGTILTVFSCSLFAYIVAKKELCFRSLIYRFTVITLYFNAGLIPWYLLMKRLHLNNNFLLYIIPSIINAYFVILIKTYIEQIPPSLEESARIDGAGYFRTFISIIFPMSLPIIATITVFSSVGQWNAWTDNFFLVSDQRLQTLQLKLYNYLRQVDFSSLSMTEISSGALAKRSSPESIKATLTVIVTLPIMMVYPYMQKYFIKGLFLGAIKG
ncbi:MAG TPA: carbohydrate ABC transporter permease [Clostridiales bacterium]|nr:carbohydrate ABC transporter permease [Clostridiales bacterium]